MPTPPGHGARFGLADELGKMGSGKASYRLPMPLETEAVFQCVGHELAVGRLLKRQELLEEGDGFGRPGRPMVAARKPGGELGALLEEAGAEPVKVCAANPELERGFGDVDQPIVELPEDLLKEQVGEAFSDLLFL